MIILISLYNLVWHWYLEHLHLAYILVHMMSCEHCIDNYSLALCQTGIMGVEDFDLRPAPSFCIYREQSTFD